MKKVKIPILLRFKIYLGLLLSIGLFISLYIVLYLYGGWFLVVVGFIPLIVVFSIKSEFKGDPIKRKDQPELFKIIGEIAEQLNLLFPDEIFLIPSAEIFVTGMFKKRLFIGLASLRELSVGEFKSIIAHELGHFYGRDTIIGGFFWRVEQSLDKTAQFGKKWWEVIPFARIAFIGIIIMVFYKIYQFLFNIINYYYSRQIEYRADFVASEVAGKTNFHNGLLNYAAFTQYFNYVGYAGVINLLKDKKMFVNIYENLHKAFLNEDINKIKMQLVQNEKMSLFSSHPSLKDRLDKIKTNDNATATNSSLTLFNKPNKLEKDMTKLFTQHIHNQIVLKKLYDDAVAREGKCKHCGEQFQKLKDLLEHEAKCGKNQKSKSLTY